MSYYIIDKYGEKDWMKQQKTAIFTLANQFTEFNSREKKLIFIREMKYLIERITIDFNFNSLQAEKANAFSILRIFFWAVFVLIPLFNGYFKQFLVLLVWVTVWMQVFAGSILDGELLLYIILFYFNWGSIENWSNKRETNRHIKQIV